MARPAPQSSLGKSRAPSSGKGVPSQLANCLTLILALGLLVIVLQFRHQTAKPEQVKLPAFHSTAAESSYPARSGGRSWRASSPSKPGLDAANQFSLAGELFKLLSRVISALGSSEADGETRQQTRQHAEHTEVAIQYENLTSHAEGVKRRIAGRRRVLRSNSSHAVCTPTIAEVWDVGEAARGSAWAWPGVAIGEQRCERPPRLRLCCRPRRHILILMWTKVYRKAFLPWRGGTYPFLCCSGVQLSYTSNRAMQSKADIIEYHMEDAFYMDRSRHRARNKLTMLFVHESQLEWTRVRTTYNLLRSFTTAADIYQPYFAGGGECLCNRSLRALPVPFSDKLADVPLLALVTNCQSYSGREGLLQSLMAAVNTHSVGHCFHNKRAAAGGDAVATAAPYKFTFAVENSVCSEYVTEKYFRLFAAGSVPVVASVNGKPGYERLSPTPESYLDVARLDSLAEAVAEIRSASADRKRYMAYHSYRSGSPGDADAVSQAYLDNVCREPEGHDSSWCYLAGQMATEQGRKRLASTRRGDIRPGNNCLPKDVLLRRYPKPAI